MLPKGHPLEVGANLLNLAQENIQRVAERQGAEISDKMLIELTRLQVESAKVAVLLAQAGSLRNLEGLSSAIADLPMRLGRTFPNLKEI